jgi:hypothetical protein
VLLVYEIADGFLLVVTAEHGGDTEDSQLGGPIAPTSKNVEPSLRG